MSTTLTEDVRVLRSGLAGDEPEIEVTLRLPRESAKKVLALLDAEQTTGAVVVPAKQEFTTTEAAKILGMSRRVDPEDARVPRRGPHGGRG